MRRILLTGMSGTGKSSAVERLNALGYKAVDADSAEYSEYVDLDPNDPRNLGAAGEWRWRENRIARLLDTEDADVLFVSGTSSNQSRFYPRFDHIVLLTASDALMTKRLAARTNNPYGKDPQELARQLELKPLVEGWLRKVADLEIDTSAPLDAVVAKIVELSVGPEV